MASTACAALRSAGIPEDEWLSELRGLQREDQLEQFVAAMREHGAGSAAPPPPDDDFVTDDIADPAMLASSTSRRDSPPPVVPSPAAAAPPPTYTPPAAPPAAAAAFAHIDPNSKKECLYRCARKAALFPSVSLKR